MACAEYKENENFNKSIIRETRYDRISNDKIPMEFIECITGHDRETIYKMYNYWIQFI